MIGMLVAFDQLTKFLIISKFRLGESTAIIQSYFNLTLVHNPGAAFGMLATLPQQWREPFFLIVPFITLVIIMTVFVKLQEDQHISIYSLSMIIGGALGNLIDRVRLGYVIDFLDFHWDYKHHFPAFNVADSAISIGVFLLLISMFYEKDPRKT
jgi:signal peptidase II